MAGDTPHDAGASPPASNTPKTSTNATGPESHAPGGQATSHGGFWALTIGAIGVVFGDIGTSPLYALREAIDHARTGVGGDLERLAHRDLAHPEQIGYLAQRDRGARRHGTVENHSAQLVEDGLLRAAGRVDHQAGDQGRTSTHRATVSRRRCPHHLRGLAKRPRR